MNFHCIFAFTVLKGFDCVYAKMKLRMNSWLSAPGNAMQSTLRESKLVSNNMKFAWASSTDQLLNWEMERKKLWGEDTAQHSTQERGESE